MSVWWVMLITMTMACQGQPEPETPADTEPAQEAPPASIESSAEPAEMRGLNVHVLYRERMRLPPTALIKVVLQDSAKMDARSKVIAEQSVPAQHGPPYELKLTYSAADLNEQGRYTVRARIEEDGQLLFTSTQTTPAFGVDGAASGPANDPIELLVERVPSSRPASSAKLTGVKWRLTMLNEKPYDASAGAEQPSLQFSEQDGRVSGNSGCNRVTGGYTVDADQLRFGKLVMTKRACLKGMAIEREFAKALEEAQRHTLSNNKLTLYSGDGRAVAAFQAVAGDAPPGP